MRPGDREVSTDDAPNLDWREQAWLLKNSKSQKTITNLGIENV
jgi:hypothetical protein